MFYGLTGKIIHKDEQSVALLVGGVGFKCFTTRSTIARINASSNQEETLFTYLNVREDALDLLASLRYPTIASPITAARTPIIAITTMISTSVKPFAFFIFVFNKTQPLFH